MSRVQSLVDLLDERALAAGSEPFLECGTSTRTFDQLAQRSRQLAGGILGLGVARGDRIAILLDNCVEFVETIFACQRLGLVAVPLNIYLRGAFLKYQLEDSGAVLVVTDAQGLGTIAELGPGSWDKTSVVVDGAASGEKMYGYSDLLDAPAFEGDSCVRQSDVAAILYTSGTTGNPKGCVVPHGQFVQNAPEFLQDAGYILAGDFVLSPALMFHAGFLVAVLPTALTVGARLHVVQRFHASRFMETARDLGATVIYGLGPNGMLMLAQPPSPSDAAPHQLRLAVMPPMPPASQLEFERRFGVRVLCECYGQTEFIVISAASVQSEPQRGSAGQPIAGVEVAIVDEDELPVDPEQIGEIVIRPRRPYMMFQGYWNADRATVASSTNLWHHTGDLGRLSRDGTLWLVDRKQDSMRRRGENVSSQQLEGAIGQHPAVREVAVHAVPGDFSDDEIKACIVLRSEESVEISELFEYFKRSLPYFAIPRYIEILDSLPINAIGRVQKHLLRDRGITDNTIDLDSQGMRVSREERRAPPVRRSQKGSDTQ